jgi:hypothetical protein
MRRMILIPAALGLVAALVQFACGDSMAPPLGGGATGGKNGGNAGGTNSGDGGSDNGAASSGGGTQPTGGSGPTSCGTVTGSGNITEQYGFTRVTRNGLEYIVQNNVWGNASAVQKLTVSGPGFTVVQQTGDNSGSGSPVSFPSVFIGANGGHISANSGLPRAVNTISAINTSFSTNANGSIAGIYNAAYDVWFSTSSAGEPSAGSPSGGFLMVWLYKPTQKNPIGGLQWSGQTIPGADGTWNIYSGYNGNKPCISYVRSSTTTSLTFDLNNFIKDAVNNRNGAISNSWYLTNVFGGFEIWSGGTGLQVSCFYVEIH